MITVKKITVREGKEPQVNRLPVKGNLIVDETTEGRMHLEIMERKVTTDIELKKTPGVKYVIDDETGLMELKVKPARVGEIQIAEELLEESGYSEFKVIHESVSRRGRGFRVMVFTAWSSQSDEKKVFVMKRMGTHEFGGQPIPNPKEIVSAIKEGINKAKQELEGKAAGDPQLKAAVDAIHNPCLNSVAVSGFQYTLFEEHKLNPYLHFKSGSPELTVAEKVSEMILSSLKKKGIMAGDIVGIGSNITIHGVPVDWDEFRYSLKRVDT